MVCSSGKSSLRGLKVLSHADEAGEEISCDPDTGIAAGASTGAGDTHPGPAGPGLSSSPARSDRDPAGPWIASPLPVRPHGDQALPAPRVSRLSGRVAGRTASWSR